VLRLQLEHFAEGDIETASHEPGGGHQKLGQSRAGQRMLAEVGDRFLLAGGRAQLLLGMARLLGAEPPEPLGAQLQLLHMEGTPT
jgi:hypothetical protein